jgi:hypothetical protein
MPTPSAFSNNNPNIPLPPSFRTDELYGGDPTAAMMAVLRQMGVNTFRTNPFVARLLGAAPGLQAAWQLSNIGAKGDDIDANGGIGQMFGDFLRGQLQGGSIMSTLANARSNMPNYANQLNDLTQQVTNGMDPTQVPAFVKFLDTQLNNPNQFAELYGSLMAPALGPMARSYQSALNASTFNSAQNRLLPPDQGGQADLINGPSFFDWIMGRR